jgi:hypothetical protein
MNRQLLCLIARGGDSAVNLAAELVQHGFIHPQVNTQVVPQQLTSPNITSPNITSLNITSPDEQCCGGTLAVFYGSGSVSRP